VINQIVKDIGDYITYPEQSTWILAVKGDPGSGKTLFARAILSEVLKK
jgi:tRNA A37 threonylcarbamoyladenosine biosynthesis protein TsaE